MMLRFQVNVLFFTMELGDLKHLVRYFYIDACLAKCFAVLYALVSHQHFLLA